MGPPRPATNIHDMRNSGCRSGTTLADLIIAIAVLAVVTTIAAPRLVTARNAMAVRAARDAAAGEIERARTMALARGTSRIVLDPASAQLRLEAPAGTAVRDPVRFADAFRVQMSIDGHSAGTVALDFNAMGLGVSANRTIRFQRGAVEARLSMSLYGRVRRW
jgi:type II secretory pathway pseudopilin PulG